MYFFVEKSGRGRQSSCYNHMEYITFLAQVCIAVLLMSNCVLSDGDVRRHEYMRSTLIDRMDNIQSQLTDVTNQLSALDTELREALYECVHHGELCRTIQMEEALKSDDMLASPFRALSKRSIRSQDRFIGLLRELSRKRGVLKDILGVLHGTDSVLRTERKRSCNLNLGFHCQTEEISNFADMYDFLSSPMSPGKKRSGPSVA